MAKETPLELLQQKLEAIQRQEVIATDASEKFKLGKDIREVEEQIDKLSGGPSGGTNVEPAGGRAAGPDFIRRARQRFLPPPASGPLP